MINEIRFTIAEFLRTIIIDNHIIFIDLWSILHIAFGVLIILLLIKLKKKRPFTILIAILLIWELFEFINYGILKNSLFIKEKTIDIVWDLVFGIFGGTITKLINNNRQNSQTTTRRQAGRGRQRVRRTR